METKTAVTQLGALAQESRLAVFRLLVRHGDEGLAAGRISELTGIAPSSLSFHLKELSHAGLLSSRQEGRFIYYSPNFEQMNALLAYLTENCCAGGTCELIPATRCTPSRAAR
ncbi:ArsR/SmtB family transcription factor [Uliginosibacterium sp. sgz301328]|uniref:ArsR/SmtB family transcription factor n=1 Tax=Uliginosibacterium sp. sgz301328 TaxID=3243764 RepID=UPI00359EB39E